MAMKSASNQTPQHRLMINRHRQKAKYFVEDLGDGVTLKMVAIPPGTFLMGSPEMEEGHSDDESPQHEVKVTSFFMGKYPVTQAQWQAVASLSQIKKKLTPNPSAFKGTDRPVEQVSWYDAVEFCNRLSQQTGRPYRLPSEAEWEYACRAGMTTPFHFGETITPKLANYNGNVTYGKGVKGEYREQTTPVGSFGVGNKFGLYDMHGNVSEWCADHWHITMRERQVMAACGRIIMRIIIVCCGAVPGTTFLGVVALRLATTAMRGLLSKASTVFVLCVPPRGLK
jgi:formylglycine-generating enzyme required for sulfatase activity